MATSEKLPQLTEAQIQAIATEQSYERGERYYRNGAILNPTRQGWTLWADCQGTELYRPKITFNAKEVVSSSCTCPYDWGGLCKHQVALLLTYVHQPRVFQEIPPLENLLASRSHAELVALIDRMVQRYPDLLAFVELATARSANTPVNTAPYRRQVQRALKRDDIDDVVEDLQIPNETAKELLEAGDWLNAGLIYQTLLEETTAHYDDEMFSMDYDGDLAGLAIDFAEGLGACLDQAQNLDSRIRQDWLTTLWDAVCKDLELGGVDYAAGSSDFLLEYATDEEWEWLESLIRDRIAQSDRWERDTLVGLLSERCSQHGEDDAANQLIHELGSPEQRAFLLVKEGKIDEAITLAQHHLMELPGLVVRFADALIEAGKPDRALQYITSQPSQLSHSYQDWLAKYHQQYSDPETALEAQYQLFLLRPFLDSYQQLQKLAEKVGRWQKLRSEILNYLEQKNSWTTLIDIAVAEKDIDRAKKLLSKLPYRGQSQQYVLKIAQAAETVQPLTAITLYQQLVEQLIEQRGRSSYQTAARYLKQVKPLYPSESDWKADIQKLRSQHSNLPALRDELNRAGL